MTVMTLMTLICGCLLKGGLYFVGSLILSIKPDKPDTGSKKPHSYAVFDPIIGVGFFESSPNPTP